MNPAARHALRSASWKTGTTSCGGRMNNSFSSAERGNRERDAKRCLAGSAATSASRITTSLINE